VKVMSRKIGIVIILFILVLVPVGIMPVPMRQGTVDLRENGRLWINEGVNVVFRVRTSDDVTSLAPEEMYLRFSDRGSEKKAALEDRQFGDSRFLGYSQYDSQPDSPVPARRELVIGQLPAESKVILEWGDPRPSILVLFSFDAVRWEDAELRDAIVP
jgi:hypothetical protein